MNVQRLELSAAWLLAIAFILSALLPLGAGAPSSQVHSIPDMITFPFLGGTITMSPDLATGDRFLRLVTPPEFSRTAAAMANPRLQPGDGGDQAPFALERRITDYSYMNEEWTGGMRITGVHGTPDAYVCICDAIFVMANTNGPDPTLPLAVIDAAHVWFDNITVYGGGLFLERSDRVVVSNSLFIDSAGIVAIASANGVVHNVSAIAQRGPSNLLNGPPRFLGGQDFHCFPDAASPCEATGVHLRGGFGWVIEWSYIHGAGGVGTDGSTRDVVIRHNTLRDAALGWGPGANEIAWNLVRGNAVDTAGSYGFDSQALLFHNNSILFPFKLDWNGIGIAADPGLWLSNCSHCELRHNDFLGYGLRPALACSDPGHIIANDNYWGTLHDPRLPAGLWIVCDGVRLERWETTPNHEVGPIMYTLDYRDVPWWVEQITGLPTYPL